MTTYPTSEHAARRASVAGLVLLFALAGAAWPEARAQATRAGPNLGYVYPAGGQQGTTFTVSIGGQNLNGTTAASFSTPAAVAKLIGYERPLTQKEINDLREKLQQLTDKRTAAKKEGGQSFTAEDEKEATEIRRTLTTRGNRQAPPALAETVTLEVTLLPDAPPGDHELRLKTPAGLSHPLVFSIGQLPENVPPVVTATSARDAVRPRLSDPRDRGTLEVTLPAAMNGQILPGEVDRFRFLARQGQRLVFAVAARALIPYLADAVPGWFQATIAIHDAKGRELAYADDYRFNPDPVVSCEIPADGMYTLEIKDAIYRGREDFVYRITAGELPFVTSIFPLGGTVGQPVTLALQGWHLPRPSLDITEPSRGPGAFSLSVREQGMLSNPVRFALSSRASQRETEPNDAGAAAQTVTLPVVVDGRIDRTGDEDIFRFEGRGGDDIVAEVLARRLGSPIDSVLTLTDGSGRRLATNDDWDDRGSGLLTHHADSRLQVTLPADGTYFLRVADTQKRGGTDYGYRLQIGPPQPDFELRVVPSAINLRAGATVPVTIHALRRDGFRGEIIVGLQNAPAGFALSGARIPAHQESVRVTLTIPANVREGTLPLTVLGAATILGRDVVHRAVPADDRMQAFAYRHLVPARELRVNVAGRGSTLRLAERPPVRFEADGTVRIRISTPGLRQVGALNFELLEPPEGLSVRRVQRRGDITEVELVADLGKIKPGTQGNLILQAYGERPGTAGAKDKPSPARNSLGILPAIPFEMHGSGSPRT
ncbi:MAG: PPC domain-containing protein [Opitutaceae bacterium]|nr:PPC domain-containing protein [Opitutaceae bacterium]